MGIGSIGPPKPYVHAIYHQIQQLTAVLAPTELRFALTCVPNGNSNMLPPSAVIAVTAVTQFVASPLYCSVKVDVSHVPAPMNRPRPPPHVTVALLELAVAPENNVKIEAAFISDSYQQYAFKELVPAELTVALTLVPLGNSNVAPPFAVTVVAALTATYVVPSADNSNVTVAPSHVPVA